MQGKARDDRKVEPTMNGGVRSKLTRVEASPFDYAQGDGVTLAFATLSNVVAQEGDECSGEGEQAEKDQQPRINYNA